MEEASFYDLDLFEANLRRANLAEADLRGASFNGANLSEANLIMADLEGVDMRKADLEKVNLSWNTLQDALLNEANLVETNLQHAKLRGVSLTRANLVETNLRYAYLTDCQVYGISLWRVHLEGAIQRDLVITEEHEPTITVDNLEVAQFVSLLLRYQTIRDTFDIKSKNVVLMLGCFTPNRRTFLSPLWEELSRHNLIPLTLDVGASGERDVTAPIRTLDHPARFILADLTDAGGLPQALQALIPHLPSIPVQPIRQANAKEDARFEYVEKYPWILPTSYYQDIADVLSLITECFIMPIGEKES